MPGREDKGGRSRGEATRGHLLAAARTVFAERGYGGTTVASITAAADTAHGTFYLYFKNKEAIFLHVISDVLDDLYLHSFTPIDELPDHHDPKRSRERIAGFLGAFARHGAIWRAILEGALASRVVEAHWMEQRQRFVGAVAERWEVFQDSGSLPPFDTDLAANALSSMLEWFAFTSVVFGQGPGADGEGRDPGEGMADPAVIDGLAALWAKALGMAR